MQVDRHGVLQMGQVGQPQGGRVRHVAAGLRQGGQLRVGGGDEHHLGGRLAQIDGLGAVVDASGSCGEQVHF